MPTGVTFPAWGQGQAMRGSDVGPGKSQTEVPGDGPNTSNRVEVGGLGHTALPPETHVDTE